METKRRADAIEFRCLITRCTDPYRNLAAEELLLEMPQDGEVILYLWQNEHTVVIGRNQDARNECRTEALEASGGRLARRLTGGGAVYHDMGNQNFTFLCKKPWHSLEKQTEVIRLAARSFGIEAERSGRNDILAYGRKFSGNAFLQRGGFCCHHGTVLISSDMDRLQHYLKPAPSKLAGKGISSVRSRVVNLAELDSKATPESMRSALLEAACQVYGASLRLVDEGIFPRDSWDALAAKHASDEWKYGRTFPCTVRRTGRLSFGEVSVALLVRGGIVEQSQIHSDSMDAEWVAEAQALLAGSPFDAESLAQAVSPLAGTAPLMADELAAFVFRFFDEDPLCASISQP